MYTLVAYCLFCWVALGGTNDISLFDPRVQIKLPFANIDISYSAFYFFGPAIAFGLWVFLQIFVGELERMRRAGIDFQPHAPYLFCLTSKTPRLISHFIIYLLAPLTVALFTYRFLAHPNSHFLLYASLTFFLFVYALPLIRNGFPRSLSYKKGGCFSRLYLGNFLGVILSIGMLGDFAMGNTRFWSHRTAEFSDIAASGMELVRVNLRALGLNLVGADFSRQALKDKNLSGIDLRHAVFVDTNLVGVNLRRAKLSDADFTGANMSGARLEGAVLGSAIFKNVNLSKAVLKKADLSGAKMHYTNMKDADLENAHLDYAEFNGANLTGANMKNADIREAYLKDALGLTAEQLKSACYSRDTRPKSLPSALENVELQRCEATRR